MALAKSKIGTTTMVAPQVVKNETRERRRSRNDSTRLTRMSTDNKKEVEEVDGETQQNPIPTGTNQTN